MIDTAQLHAIRYLAPRAIVGAVIAAAAVAILSIVVGDFSDLSWRLIGTVFVFGILTVSMWLDVWIAERRPGWFAGLSLIADAYVFVAGVIKVWSSSDAGYVPPVFEWFWVIVIARVALLHVDLVRITAQRLRAVVISAVCAATYPLIALLGIGLTLPVFAPDFTDSDVYWRTVGVVAVLDLLGTILIPLTWMLFHRGEEAAPFEPVMPAWIGETQAAPGGAAPGGAWRDVGAPPAPPTPAPAPAPAPASGPAAPVSSPSPTVWSDAVFTPPAQAYSRPPQRRLAWPRYEDGTPVPVREDGSPDFRGVIGHPDAL